MRKYRRFVENLKARDNRDGALACANMHRSAVSCAVAFHLYRLVRDVICAWEMAP
jgi:hypothetical protein